MQGQDSTGEALPVVAGQVVSVTSGDALPFAEVYVLRASGEFVTVVEADDAGRFRVEVDGPGSYYLQAGTVGHEPLQAGPVALASGQTLNLRLRLRPVYNMDSLVVTVNAREPTLSRNGFYERVQRGFGSFLARRDFEQRNYPRLADYLSRLPGVAVSGRTVYFTRAQGMSTRGGLCYPALLLDGALISNGGLNDPPPLDMVIPDQLAGVEIYRGGAGTPMEFTGSNRACGVIVIWTL
ncbi:MAG: TonB-dependent receptor [Gemmatimonadales bacterium]|nr:MAG: TonB-dependent receptor [Gemmatimonadales bacterium]